MPTFGVISEGPTDFAVLKNMLEGFFKSDDEITVVNAVQPKAPTDPGGWTLVMRSLRDRDVPKALQFNDWVVVQVDTDVCEEKGFEVPRIKDGHQLTTAELILAVRARLLAEMGADAAAAAARTIFAIAVHELECWLLPALYDRSAQAKSAKTTGCLEAANEKLRADRLPVLSKQDGSQKDPRAYRAASTAYRKKRVLVEAGGRNESLGLFVAELEALGRRTRGG